MSLHAVAITLGRLAPDPVALVTYLALFATTAVLAYRRPAYAAAVLIATMPFALYRDVVATTLTLAKVALVAAVAGLAWRAAAGRLDITGVRAVLPIPIALGLLVAATALSIVRADHPDAAVRETFKAAQYLVTAAAAFAAWRSDPDERPIRYALFGTLGVTALAALAQEFVGAPSVLQAGSALLPRIAGPLEGPNQLAGFLGLALPLATAFALSRKPSPAEFLAIGLGVVALALTFSRAGAAAAFVAMTIAIAGSPLASRKRLLRAAGLTLGLTLLATAAVAHWDAWSALTGHMFSAAESAQPGGVGRRSDLWRAALLLWQAHPWFGIGAGNFEYAVGTIVPGVRTHANNAYLQAFAEGGVVLGAATAAALLMPLVLFARAARSSSLVLGAFASCVAFALHQFLDDLLFFPKVGGLYWLIVGLAAGEIARLRATRPPAGPP